MVLVAHLTMLLGLVSGVPFAIAAGPWQAQIVDAETKGSLEGVVVLAVWTKHRRGLGGASSEYYDSEEVVTDREGRFIIHPEASASVDPLVSFRGPIFEMFKPGYGRAIWPGYAGLPKDRRKELGEGAKLFELPRIVLEMPRLKTIEERKEYIANVLRFGVVDVPAARMPRFQQAIAAERREVGLGN